MATDPYVPLALKPHLSARVGGVPRRANPEAASAGVDTTAPIPPTAAAVNAGPPRPVDVVEASASVAPRPPSPLDANAPLPAGVRLYGGTPGTNDVIYEGRGRFGERAFGNNQFNVDGRVRGANPALDAQADLRAREITASVDSQRAAQAAAAQAAATAPMTAKDLTDRMTAEADINAKNADTRIKRVMGTLDAQAKANANVINDYFTKVAEAQSPEAAAALAADAGLDPSDPSLPPLARAGATAARRSLIDLVNSGPAANFALGGGKATDNADFGDFQIDQPTWYRHAPRLTGPADEHGVRRAVYISDRDAQRLAPLLRGRGVKRRASSGD